jgi:hypothetical protein
VPKLIVPALCLFMGLAGGALFGIFSKESDLELSSTGSVREDRSVDGPSVRRTTTPVVLPPTDALPPEIVDEAKKAIASELTATPKGNSEIRGSVKRSDGNPLPGAIVRIESDPSDEKVDDHEKKPSVGLARPVDRSLESELKNVMRDYVGREKSRVDVRTDASGQFRFDGLDPDRKYFVRAAAEGHKVALPQAGGEFHGAPGSVVDFIATPVIRLPIAVAFEDGTVPELAMVDAWREGGQFFHSVPWTAEKSEIEVVAGLLRLSASLPNREDLTSEPLLIDAPMRDSAKLPIKLTLRPRLRIRGRLIYPAGDVPMAVRVSAVPMRAEQTIPDEAFAQAPLQTWIADRNADFSVEGEVAKGKYAIAVLRNEAVVARTEAEVTSGTTWVEVTMPPLAKADFVVVKVMNPRGELLRDVGVWDSQIGENGIPRSDGTYWMARRRSKGTAEERQPLDQSTLNISSMVYGNLNIDYSPATSSEVTAQYEESATLIVDVAGYAGSRFEGKLSVSMRIDHPVKRAGHKGGFWDGESFGGRRSRESDGKWTFAGLQPVAVEILLYVNAQNSTIVVEEIKKQLVSGTNQVTFSLPVLHAVVIDIGEVASDAISLAPRGPARDGSYIFGMADASGRATFEVLAGDYIASRNSETDEYCSTLFSVPTSDLVKIEKKKADALEIVSSPPEGLTSLGFKVGDLLIGTSKSTWTANPSAKLNALASVAGQTSIKVLRGGTEIDVAFEGQKFNQARWMTGLRAVARRVD